VLLYSLFAFAPSATTSVSTRPTELTAEVVVKDFGPWLRKIIRQFSIPDTESDDLFNEIILAFITPSSKLGTTYLQRYDPSKGAVTTYLYLHAHHILKAQHRKCKKRRRMQGVREEETALADWYKHTLKEMHLGKEERNVYNELEGAQIRRALRPHGSFQSRSPQGKKRSTRRIGLAVLKGQSIPEISAALDLTPTAVRRRLQSLRSNKALRAIARDRGMIKAG
jgi:DNA-directed RNA polymerase specialized sigma24 family protein